MGGGEGSRHSTARRYQREQQTAQGPPSPADNDNTMAASAAAAAASAATAASTSTAAGGAPTSSTPDFEPHIPPGLIASIRAGECVAFVGAGFSAPAGFPMWSDLLRRIASAASADGRLAAELAATVDELVSGPHPAAHALDQAAQLLEDALGVEGLVSYMRRFLRPKQLPLAASMQRRLKLLAQLPFRAILTTNFNPLIEGWPLPNPSLQKI